MMTKRDLIKRSEIIEAIDDIDWYRQNASKEMVSGAKDVHEAWYKAEDVYKALESVPPAQPEQKTGKWIDAVLPNDNGGLPVQVCDQCNTFFPLAYTGGGHRFCPSCGAKMEVEHD